MKLIDTNLIIYAAQPDFRWLLPLITTPECHFATVTKIEVLGFKEILPPEEQFFRTYFSALSALDLTDEVIEKAIGIRQSKKIKLGDAIIAATALVHDLELLTHNTDDFRTITGLVLSDPIP
jgi:toxin FitB